MFDWDGRWEKIRNSAVPGAQRWSAGSQLDNFFDSYSNLFFCGYEVVKHGSARPTSVEEAPIPVFYILTSQACCHAFDAPCRSSSPLISHGTQVELNPFFSS